LYPQLLVSFLLRNIFPPFLARSTSWRDGTNDNGLSNDIDRANGSSQPSNHQNSSSPNSGESGGGGNGTMVNSSTAPMKPQASYKKSWDDDSNLPEWATESFDYGGTFDATGAFHDSERVIQENDKINENVQKAINMKKQQQLQLQQQQQQHQQQQLIEPPAIEEPTKVEESPPPPSKFMDFLNDESTKSTKLKDEKPIMIAEPTSVPPSIPSSNSNPSSAPIAQMDKMVENFVAHLIMDDDTSSGNAAVKQPPAPQIEWFYRDPQGDTQGAFSSNDMSEWYKAGYFQESLMVRRSIDTTFVPLGHLVKIFGVSRPFISASLDGGPPIPPVIHPEIIDPFRMQRMMTQPTPPLSTPQPTPDVNNWSMMTTEQRMFLMQLAHQRPPQAPQVDPFNVMKPPPQPQPAQQQQQQQQSQQPPQQQSTPLDLRRLMSGNDFFQSTAPPPVVPQTTQIEPDPIQQLIMQLQMQQKTGGDAAQQWIKSSQQQQQQQQQPNVMMSGVNNGNGPLDLSSLAAMQGGPSSVGNQQQVNKQGPSSVGNSVSISFCFIYFN